MASRQEVGRAAGVGRKSLGCSLLSAPADRRPACCAVPPARPPTHPLAMLQVVQLPQWPGRVWQLVTDTSKVGWCGVVGLQVVGGTGGCMWGARWTAGMEPCAG